MSDARVARRRYASDGDGDHREALGTPGSHQSGTTALDSLEGRKIELIKRIGCSLRRRARALRKRATGRPSWFKQLIRTAEIAASDTDQATKDRALSEFISKTAPALMQEDRFEDSHFGSESERGCVIIGTALLDDALSELLEAKFVKDELLPRDVVKFLLTKGPVPPLRPFAMKIIMCRAFGLISEETYASLEAIRQARNEFSHSSEAAEIDLTLLGRAISMAEANPFVEKLRNASYWDASMRRKAQFMSVVWTIELFIHVVTMTLVGMEEYFQTHSSNDKS